MSYKEKTIKSEKIYSGRILTLKVNTVEMPNKKYSKREIIEHPGAAVVLPVLPDGRILLVKNYRSAIGRTLLELPAGLIEAGEEPKQTAQRELQEETGYEAGEMLYLFDTFTSAGFTNEKQQFFLAKDLRFISKEIDEEIESIALLTLDELLQKIDHCGVMDAKTVIGALYLERIWTQHFSEETKGGFRNA